MPPELPSVFPEEELYPVAKKLFEIMFVNYGDNFGKVVSVVNELEAVATYYPDRLRECMNDLLADQEAWSDDEFQVVSQALSVLAANLQRIYIEFCAKRLDSKFGVDIVVPAWVGTLDDFGDN